MKKKTVDMEKGDGTHARTEERKSAQKDDCAMVSRQKNLELGSELGESRTRIRRPRIIMRKTNNLKVLHVGLEKNEVSCRAWEGWLWKESGWCEDFFWRW